MPNSNSTILQRDWCIETRQQVFELDMLLIQKISKGDKEAFERIYDKYNSSVFSLAKSITNSASDARQILIDVFTDIITKSEGSIGEEVFRIWLYRKTVNASLVRLGSGISDEKPPKAMLSGAWLGVNDHLRADNVDWSDRVDEEVSTNELQRVLTGALNELPVEYKLVVLLRDMEQCSNEEVAHILQLPVQEQKIKLHQARLYLRRAIDECFHKEAKGDQ